MGVMMDKNYCFKCLYFEPVEEDVFEFDNTNSEMVMEWANQPENEAFSYECRRYPPVHVGKSAIARFPKINLFYWCGQFWPRPCRTNEDSQ